MYDRWVEAGYFTADNTSDKPPFCIVIPPPNVTGSLHIGHAFEHTLIDILVRRRRMQGYDTLWLPGMDHASIAVHALVERALAAEGTNRRELGREAFIDRSWEWKAEHGGAILAQMRRLGDSVDWSRERFTMDEGSNRAVLTMFKRLYDDGLIYRAERMVNWSPEMRSVLSDVEVEHKDVDGELVSIRYGDGADSVVVATTRVETMLGDTAVAVHPDDERYRHLIGRQIELPLVGRMIPVVADEHVDPAFGTGALKITPAHDPNDFEIGRRHGLPMPTIMDETGHIAGSGTEFDGLDRFAARAAVKEALRAQGRIVAEKRAPAQRRPRPARQVRAHRAAAVAAVVRQGRAAGQGGGRRGAQRRRRGPPQGAGAALVRLGRQHARLVHLPAALVGPPHPGLVRAGRRGRLLRARRGAARGLTSRTRTCSTPGSPRGCGRSPRWAGRSTRATWRSTTRRPCWSRATTSSSSGSPG